MQIGDHIFIYETKTGRQLRDRVYNYKVGKQGIIALVKAISLLETDEELEKYEDGSEILWGWRVRTKLVRKCYISRKDVCKIFNYSPNYIFRGFGYLRKLTKKYFETLQSMCK